MAWQSHWNERWNLWKLITRNRLKDFCPKFDRHVAVINKIICHKLESDQIGNRKVITVFRAERGPVKFKRHRSISERDRPRIPKLSSMELEDDGLEGENKSERVSLNSNILLISKVANFEFLLRRRRICMCVCLCVSLHSIVALSLIHISEPTRPY